MNILITGAAGYLGSYLVKKLLEKKHKVTALDNLYFKQNSLDQFQNHSGFEFIKDDVRNHQLLNKILPKFDLIIPLAGFVGIKICEENPVEAEEINKNSVIYLHSQLSENQLMIYPGSCSSYGHVGTNDEIKESHPLSPSSHYAKTKAETETLFEGKKNVIILRFATVFGFSPKMRKNLLLNNLVHDAYTLKKTSLYEEHFRRDFVHISDSARSIIHAIENLQSMKGEVYNVGSPKNNISKLEICQLIQKSIPDFNFQITDHITDIDKRNFRMSFDKLENTGFKTMVSIEEGIKELIQAYQNEKRQKS